MTFFIVKICLQDFFWKITQLSSLQRQVVRPLKQSNTDKRRTNNEKVAREDLLHPEVITEYRSSRVTMIDYRINIDVKIAGLPR